MSGLLINCCYGKKNCFEEAEKDNEKDSNSIREIHRDHLWARNITTDGRFKNRSDEKATVFRYYRRRKLIAQANCSLRANFINMFHCAIKLSILRRYRAWKPCRQNTGFFPAQFTSHWLRNRNGLQRWGTYGNELEHWLQKITKLTSRDVSSNVWLTWKFCSWLNKRTNAWTSDFIHSCFGL